MPCDIFKRKSNRGCPDLCSTGRLLLIPAPSVHDAESTNKVPALGPKFVIVTRQNSDILSFRVNTENAS